MVGSHTLTAGSHTLILGFVTLSKLGVVSGSNNSAGSTGPSDPDIRGSTEGSVLSWLGYLSNSLPTGSWVLILHPNISAESGKGDSGRRGRGSLLRGCIEHEDDSCFCGSGHVDNSVSDNGIACSCPGSGCASNDW